jgi:hypothetical protein
MGHLTTQRLLKCLAVPLIVTQVGCAARGVQVSHASPPSWLGEADREACAVFAKRESKEVRVKSIAEESAKGFAYGLLAGIFVVPGAIMLAPVGAIIGGVDAARENHAVRKSAYSAAERICLRPLMAANSSGPEHPDVATALRDLAARYASQKDYVTAESLYQRALGIQERALGPESGEIATTLELYAALLQSTHREERATDLLARAGAIRVSAEPHPNPAPEPTTETDNGTPGDSIEPVIASAPILPVADESE